MSSFRITGKLALDGTKFSAGLSRAEHAAMRFGRSVTSALTTRMAALFSVGALAMFTRKMIETGEAFVVAARRMGATVEQVQILKAAAKESGIEVENLVSAFDLLTVAQAKALGGGPAGDELMKRFARAGVSEQQLRTMTGGQLAMGPISSAVRGMTQQDAVALLKPLLGRQAGGVVDVLRQDLDALGEELKRFGGIMTTETAVSLKLLKDAAEVAGQVLISHFAPALIDTVERLARFGIGLGKVVSQIIAGVGAGTANMTTWQALTAYPRMLWSGAQGIGSLAQTGSKTAMAEAFSDAMEGSGFDLVGAATAIDDAGQEWDAILGKLDALKGWIEREAERLRNPPAPIGVGIMDKSAAAKTAKGRIESDALVAVGNFIGAGRTDAIGRIAQQQLDVQRQALDVIRRIADTIPLGF